jgi:hypothetical protein
MQSSSRDMLRQKRELVLGHWFQKILEGFEERTAALLKTHADRFANPVEYSLRKAAEAIYQALVDDTDVDHDSLDYAMKLRAVQERDPIRGTAFVHHLKEAIRKGLADSLPEDDRMKLNSRIDQIASVASELFAINRAKIAEIAGRSTSSL